MNDDLIFDIERTVLGIVAEHMATGKVPAKEAPQESAPVVASGANELAIARQTAADYAAQIQLLEQDLADAQAEAKNATTKVSELEEATAQMEQMILDHKDTIKELDAEVKNSHRSADHAKKTATEARRARDAALEELSTAQSLVTARTKQRDELQRVEKRLNVHTENLRKDREQLSEVNQQLQAKLEKKESESNELVQKLTRQVENSRRANDELREKLETVADSGATKQTLKDLVAARQAVSMAVDMLVADDGDFALDPKDTPVKKLMTAIQILDGKAKK